MIGWRMKNMNNSAGKCSILFVVLKKYECGKTAVTIDLSDRLKNNGKFAAIWLAGVYGKDIKKILSRKQILKVNISQACYDVEHPAVRLSLRLQSNLMLGILRVYKEQVFHFCDVIKYAWRELRTSFHVDMRLIDLHRPMLSEDAITLKDPVAVLSPIDDFPKDIFSISPSAIFPRDDSTAFIHVGFHSPATPVSPHTPVMTPGPHQTSKDKITMEDELMPEHIDEPIQIPGDDLLSSLMQDDFEEEMVIDEQERPISPPAPDIEVPPEEHEVQIIDAETGELRSPATEERPKERERAFPESMVTPGERIEQPDVPERPHKRRKQPKDLYRTLNDDKLRRNLLTAMDTLRDRIIDLPSQQSAQELLNNPSRPELRSLPFIDMWRENAAPRQIPDDEIPELVPGAETVRVEGYGVEESYEQSRRSDIVVTETPGSPTPGQDTASFEQSRPGSRIDVSQQLPSIQEVDMDTGIEVPISPIPEGDVESEEDDFSSTLHRRVTQCMGDTEETSFSTVFPPRPRSTTRGLAAEGLFKLLEWHKRSVVVLSQPARGFSEIYIERGRNF